MTSSDCYLPAKSTKVGLHKLEEWNLQFHHSLSNLIEETLTKSGPEFKFVKEPRHSFHVKLEFVQTEAEELYKESKSKQNWDPIDYKKLQQAISELQIKLDSVDLQLWPRASERRDEISKFLKFILDDLKTVKTVQFEDQIIQEVANSNLQVSDNMKKSKENSNRHSYSSSVDAVGPTEPFPLISINGPKLELSKAPSVTHGFYDIDKVVVLTLIDTSLLPSTNQKKCPRKAFLQIHPKCQGLRVNCVDTEEEGHVMILEFGCTQSEKKSSSKTIPIELTDFYLDFLLRISRIVVETGGGSKSKTGQSTCDLLTRLRRDSLFRSNILNLVQTHLGNDVIFQVQEFGSKLSLSEIRVQEMTNMMPGPCQSASGKPPQNFPVILQLLQSTLSFDPSKDLFIASKSVGITIQGYESHMKGFLQKNLYPPTELEKVHQLVSSSCRQSFLAIPRFAGYSKHWLQYIPTLEEEMTGKYSIIRGINRENVEESEVIRGRGAAEYSQFLDSILPENITVISRAKLEAGHKVTVQKIAKDQYARMKNGTERGDFPPNWKYTLEKECKEQLQNRIQKLDVELSEESEQPSLRMETNVIEPSSEKPKSRSSSQPPREPELIGKEGKERNSWLGNVTQLFRPSTTEQDSSSTSGQQSKKENVHEIVRNLVETLEEKIKYLKEPSDVLLTTMEAANESLVAGNESKMKFLLPKLKSWVERIYSD